jgi:SAM-dependent methyltransferase
VIASAVGLKSSSFLLSCDTYYGNSIGPVMNYLSLMGNKIVTGLKKYIFLPLLYSLYRTPDLKSVYEYHYWNKWVHKGGKPADPARSLIHEKIIEYFIGSSINGLKIVDFGSGPICALNKYTKNNIVYGVDVLSNHYETMLKKHKFPHGYRFVECSEKSIPLTSDSIDLIYSSNAIDHCTKPYLILDELRRLLSNAGKMIIVVNINKKITFTEPSKIDDGEMIDYMDHNFEKLKVIRCPRGPLGSWYMPFLSGERLKDNEPYPDDFLIFIYGEKKTI